MMSRTTRIIVASFLVLAQLLWQRATDCHAANGEQTAAAPGLSLTGKPWRLEELSGESVPESKDTPLLLFTDGGELMGFGGCNYFVGKYRTGDDGKIIVSSLRASHLQCSDSSKSETGLLTSLVMGNAFLIRDDELIFSREGNNLLRLQQALDVAPDELIRQGMLIKSQSKAHKGHRKKKKGLIKSAGRTKTTTSRIIVKPHPTVTQKTK